MPHKFLQNCHLRPVRSAVRLNSREIVFGPRTRSPVSPTDPNVSISLHEFQQMLERFQAIRVRANAKLTEESLAAILPSPFGKRSNGGRRRCGVDTGRVSSRSAGVEVLMDLVDNVLLWVIHPLHYRCIWRSIG